MPDIFVGCKTNLPEPNDDRYFTVEMYCHFYPYQRDFDALIDFLQPNTADIIDEIVFIMDKDTKELVYGEIK